METKEIKSKSILIKSKLPDCDYVVNPYIGCRFGCIYCYASFMGRYVGKEIDDWGEYVHVKTNSAELLKKEILKIKDDPNLSVLFSSVTDPYQGLEAKYELTRKCLSVLRDVKYKGYVSILTKSPLVLRDVDILKELNKCEVGLTITSTQDEISRYFEKYAPNVTDRLIALEKLNKAGINTYAFVGPLLPHFIAEEKMLDDLFKSISLAGTKEIYVEHINLKKYILERFLKEAKNISSLDEKTIKTFYLSQSKSYRADLDKIVESLALKNHLKIRLGGAIYHQELDKKDQKKT